MHNLTIMEYDVSLCLLLPQVPPTLSIPHKDDIVSFEHARLFVGMALEVVGLRGARTCQANRSSGVPGFSNTAHESNGSFLCSMHLTSCPFYKW